MRKHFKMIVTIVTVLIMLETFSITSMAKGPGLDMDSATVSDGITETTENVESVEAVMTLVGEFHYTGRLTKDKVLGTVEVRSNAKTIQWTVGRTGSDGLVNLNLTNTRTGEVRIVSTVANNMLGSMDWISALPAGTWEVSVDTVSSSWLYDVDLYFYN